MIRCRSGNSKGIQSARKLHKLKIYINWHTAKKLCCHQLFWPPCGSVAEWIAGSNHGLPAVECISRQVVNLCHQAV